MRDVRHAVGLEDESCAKLTARARRPLRRSRRCSRTRSITSHGRRFERGERRRPASPSAKSCRGTAAPSARAHRTRSRPAIASTRRGVEPRLSLRRRAAEARPEIHALGARQHGVEHQHRKEIRLRRGRRMPGQLQIRRRSRPLDDHAALADLRRLDDRRARGGSGAGRNGPERPLDAAQHVVGSTSPATTSVALLGM